MPMDCCAQRCIAAAEAAIEAARPSRATVAAMPHISAVRLLEYLSISRNTSRKAALATEAITVPRGAASTTFGAGRLTPLDLASAANTSPA